MRVDRGRPLALAVAVGMLGCGGSSGPGPQGSPSPASTGFTYKALSHVSWWHDGYEQADAADARRALASTRANWAAVLVTWYMDRRDSNAIAPDPQQTPTDAAVDRAIQDLHGLGFKVMLKPHVDVKDGSWRGTIRPSDTTAWFASYDDFIAHHAGLARQNSVELLDVGTELVTMSDSSHASSWSAVIAHVRSAYSGALTYSANANATGDEFTSVAFWSLLDVAGLDVYVPLTNHAGPSREELVAAWNRNVNGEDMVAAYRNWQSGHGKPVVFTEIGYRSLAGTNRAPWDFSLQGSPDPVEQANCYDAALAVWSRESAWMKGTFWWAWPTTPAPGAGDTDYTPRGKPAEAVLQRWFGG